MSHAAICQAVRDQLQVTFGFPEPTIDYINVCFDGHPSPIAGEFFVAVHPMGWTSISADFDLMEEYQVGVTLTVRIGFAPTDRFGIATWIASPDGTSPAGLEPRLRRAITAIHDNQLVRIAANVYLDSMFGGTGGGPFLTALWLLRVEPPKLQDHTWFDAEGPPEGTPVAYCGVSQTIVFGKCQRCQDIPDMN